MAYKINYKPSTDYVRSDNGSAWFYYSKAAAYVNCGVVAIELWAFGMQAKYICCTEKQL